MTRYAIIKHEVVEFRASQEEAEKCVKELMEAKTSSDVGTYFEAVPAERRCRTCLYQPGSIYVAAPGAHAVCENPDQCYYEGDLDEVDKERQYLGLCPLYEGPVEEEASQ